MIEITARFDLPGLIEFLNTFTGLLQMPGTLAQILSNQTEHEGEIRVMSEAVDRIGAEVAQNTTVVQSAIVLLGNLSARIRELADDPAALNAFADELDANSNALAAAVQENTPAPPDTPPAPEA